MVTNNERGLCALQDVHKLSKLMLLPKVLACFFCNSWGL